MTRDTIWGGRPCPNDACPKPGPIRSWFYRTRPWICPVCCYGWIRQDSTEEEKPQAMYWMVRTSAPIPFRRPGKRRARNVKPFH